MSNRKKRVVILTEVELRKTISRLTSEIVEKVKAFIGVSEEKPQKKSES